jgi:putative ABC transport system permease protein
MIGLALFALFSGDLTFIGVGAFFFLLGLVLIAPALVRPLALVFGKVFAWMFARQGIGELAQGNLTRQPGRVALTASATMLGLAVVVAAGGLVSSMSISMAEIIKSSLGSDFLFVPPSVALWSSDVGASVDFENGLKAIEQVDVVSSLRFAGSQVDETAVSVLGIDPQAYPRVSSLSFIGGNKDDYTPLNEEGTIFINGIFSMNTGVKMGDTVALVTPNGRKPYRVAAVVSDLLNAKVITAYISQANLEKDFNVTEDVFIQLNLKEGADAAAAEKEIKALAVDYEQFTVISGKEYYKSMLAQMQAAFAGMYFVLALLAIPSLIAMLNTLAIAVIERTREIGMLRAVGATRKQVRTMITAEALLLAAFGTTFGILGGLYLGYVFVEAMGTFMPSEYVFPVPGVLAAIIIGLTFGLLAAVLPSRQAAKLDVVRALRYE